MKGNMNDEDYADSRTFQKGDRVRISEYSSYAGREGTVTTTSTAIYQNVQILIDGCTFSSTFSKTYLTRLPEVLRIPAGRREEGKGIRPEDVQLGDTIKVVRKHKDKDDFKCTTVLEGVVDRRVSTGGLVTAGLELLYSGIVDDATQIITLVSKAPDGVLATLQNFTTDTVLSWRYGKEDTLHVSVKTGKTHWQVIGADGNNRVDDTRLRELIERVNDNYEILKEGK